MTLKAGTSRGARDCSRTEGARRPPWLLGLVPAPEDCDLLNGCAPAVIDVCVTDLSDPPLELLVLSWLVACKATGDNVDLLVFMPLEAPFDALVDCCSCG